MFGVQRAAAVLKHWEIGTIDDVHLPSFALAHAHFLSHRRQQITSGEYPLSSKVSSGA